MRYNPLVVTCFNYLTLLYMLNAYLLTRYILLLKLNNFIYFFININSHLNINLIN